MLVREATVTDAPVLLAYLQKLLSEEGHNSPSMPGEFTRTLGQQREMLKAFSEEKNSIYFLAFEGDALVGELNCKGYQRSALEHVAILGMSVAAEQRRTGIGRRLMEEAVSWAQQNIHIKRLELFVFSTNVAAMALYERFGFSIEGRRKKMVKVGNKYIDDILMAKLL